MAENSLNLYLGQLLGGDNPQADNPWFLSGSNILRSEMPRPSNNTEAILGPLLQGLVGGGLAGYGRKQSENEQYKNVAAMLGGDQIRPEDVPYGPMTQEMAGIHDYSLAEAPEGWTPKIGKADAILWLINRQNQQEEEQKKREILAKYMIENSPEALAALGKKAQIEAQGKKIGEASALTQLYGTGDSSTLPIDPVERGKALRELEDRTYKRIAEAPEYKNFKDIEANFNTLTKLKDQDTKVAAIGMISAMARIWDPTSTVREGEYKINKDAQSRLDQLIGDWRAIVKGESPLMPETRQKMIEAAAAKYSQFGEQYAGIRTPLLKNLETQGGNPANVPIPDYKRYVPPGMKLQRNAKTGETRLVPQ